MFDQNRQLPLGLMQEEAEKRLRRDGPNEMPREKKRGWLVLVVQIAREPMLLLLAVACGIYFMLGSRHEAFVLSGALVGVVLISVVQERRAQHALEALRGLTSPRARVVREQRELRVPGRQVVRGDVLHVVEGDRVPADALVMQSTHLQVDESMLTGESMAVQKSPAPAGFAHRNRASADERQSEYCLFAGSLVVSGDGYALVYATGKHTEMGKIGVSLVDIEAEPSPLQRQVKRLVIFMALIGISTSALLFFTFGLRQADWLQGALSAVSVAMSLLPEEFPIVLTIFLSVGAWRLSRQRVLARHMPAIEALGAASVLCVDKTGTLTRNEMKLSGLWCSPGNALWNVELETLGRRCRHLIALGGWSSHPRAHDPMEISLQTALRTLQKRSRELGGRSDERSFRTWQVEKTFPMISERLAVVYVWRHGQTCRRRVVAKGAPESILKLSDVSKRERAEVESAVSAFACSGKRVIAIARADVGPEEEPSLNHMKFRFCGLVAFHDPLRPLVPEAVEQCRAAGLRVLMITGDYPETASAIAKEAGIVPSTAVVTGYQIDQTSDVDLQKMSGHVAVYARARPEHKLRLVRALQANQDVVAMTGDGVNDAPALRAAEIGVAMGGRGTDVAREAAALVITDDNFTSIVDGIRTGRTIYDNLQKSMSYLVAVHVLIAGVAIWPVLFGGPMILLPLHIVFLEMVIDPSCSIAFEAEPPESNVMRRPPRPKTQSLFSKRLLAVSLSQGIGVILTCIVIFEIARWQHWSDGEIRGVVFTALMSGNLMLIMVNLSWSRSVVSAWRVHNRPARWLVMGALSLHLVVLNWAPLRRVFRFDAIDPFAIVAALVLGAISVLWFEWVKQNRAGLLR